MNNNLRGALLSLLAFGIYATHDVILKTLGATYAPFQIVFFAVLFGFPVTIFLLISDKTDGHLRPVHPWWTALRVGASVVSSGSVVFAFSKLPMSQVYAILFSTPLLITVLSVPILGEVIRLRRWLAVIAGLSGVLIVLQPGSTHLSIGHAAALLGAMGSSLASITIRKIGSDERSIVLLVYPMLANFLVMGALLPFFYEPMPIGDIGFIALVAIMAVVAMTVMIGAYNAAEAVIVAPMQYSQILWATAYGYFLFGEKLDRATAIGAGVIIASGLYILMRESRSKVSDTKPVLRTTNLRFEFGARPRIGDIFRLRRTRRPGAGPE